MIFEEGVKHLTQTFTCMLNKAEDMFGERDKTWTFVGIEFYDDGPYIMYYPNKTVSIVLSTDSSKFYPNYPQLFYQLSHEVCHLLYPTGKRDANILNEGISTYFSKVYLDILFPNNDYAISNISKSIYYRAYLLVEKLMQIDSESIKKIRKKNPQISYLTKEELQSLNFQLTDNEIEELISRFSNSK